jgi:hypothetical protein
MVTKNSLTAWLNSPSTPKIGLMAGEDGRVVRQKRGDARRIDLKLP